MSRIVVPDDYPSVFSGSAAEARLREIGSAEIHPSNPQTSGELLRRAEGAEGVINIRAFCRFDAEFFSRCGALRALSIWGTGTDHVDLEAAKGAGAWPRGQMTQLSGKTLGLIGLGAIGRRTARLAAGVGMRLITWTFHPDADFAAEVGLEFVELDDLYARADVVSIHARQSADTVGMVGAEAFSRMKPGAILVNTARGPIVDEAALVSALESGNLAAAGLDVFAEEPLPPNHPLGKLENAVLSPHNAGITPEVTEAGLLMAVENIAAALSGNPQNVVAAP